MATREAKASTAQAVAASPPAAPRVAPLQFLRAGDTGRAICPHCKAMRALVYQYRQVYLTKTKVPVPNVLVGVCLDCDRTIVLPAQSTPRIKEASERVVREQTARIPLELEDRLNMMAHSLDVRPEPFKGALCRYVLDRVVRDEPFAQRVWTLAVSAEAKGTPGGRVKFRADAGLPKAAKAVAAAAGVSDLSSILRGGILAVDGMRSAARERVAMQHDLRVLAAGNGA
jgi:hypothetical protein